MKKVNLKDNIFIGGFETFQEYSDILLTDYPKAIYFGETLEIPDEIVEKCTKYELLFGVKVYTDYKDSNFGFYNPIFSIRSACNYRYCIIYETT